MKQLIITADDYGMSKAVNHAIDAGIEAGIITATNVMTNMPYYQEAKKLIGNNKIAVGMHWVLTCGIPVLPVEQIPTLVKTNGEFYSLQDFQKRYHNHLVSDDDIRRELIAQYRLFVQNIGVPDYWNTHQNFHVDLSIYKKINMLAKELGFNKMRSHQRIYVPASENKDLMPISWRILEPIKVNTFKYMLRFSHKLGMKTPDGQIRCMNRYDVKRLAYTFHNIQWNNFSVGEYVIHPATEIDSPFFGELTERRIWEYEAFSNKDTKEIIDSAGIELVSYKAL